MAPVAGPGGRKRVLLTVGAALLAGLFVTLSAWQLHRREWKLQIIARIEERAFATPAAPPEDWAEVTAARDEYRRVAAEGTWLDRPPVLVAGCGLGRDPGAG